MAQLGEQAFLGAGGYHHHIGANTWESAGAEAPPPGSAALRRATIVLPSRTALASVQDRLLERGHSPEARNGRLRCGIPPGTSLS